MPDGAGRERALSEAASRRCTAREAPPSTAPAVDQDGQRARDRDDDRSRPLR